MMEIPTDSVNSVYVKILKEMNEGIECMMRI